MLLARGRLTPWASELIEGSRRALKEEETVRRPRFSAEGVPRGVSSWGLSHIVAKGTQAARRRMWLGGKRASPGALGSRWGDVGASVGADRRVPAKEGGGRTGVIGYALSLGTPGQVSHALVCSSDLQVRRSRASRVLHGALACVDSPGESTWLVDRGCRCVVSGQSRRRAICLLSRVRRGARAPFAGRTAGRTSHRGA